MPAGKTYTPLARTTLTSAAASVTFSSISGSYTDLVLVATPLSLSADNITIQYNGDTGTNYSTTILYGTGSAAGSTRQSNTALPYLNYYGNDTTTQSNTLIHIMNYANTTTYKTALARANQTATGGGVDAIAMLWRSTAAITSIVLKQPGNNNFAVGSTFTLYGILAA